MTDERIAEIKHCLARFAGFLAEAGDPLVPHNQGLLLAIANELLAAVGATVPASEQPAIIVGGSTLYAERSWLEAVRDIAAQNDWDIVSQRVAVADCLEMLAIVEARRAPPAPTPSQEAPPVPEPMTDSEFAAHRLVLDTIRDIRLRGVLLDGDSQDVLLRRALELLAEVARLRALPPAAGPTSSPEEYAREWVARAIAEAFAHAGEILDRLDDADEDDEPEGRVVDATEVEERLQDIIDEMYAEDTSDAQVRLAFEGILKLMGWVDGKTDHAAA